MIFGSIIIHICRVPGKPHWGWILAKAKNGEKCSCGLLPVICSILAPMCNEPDWIEMWGSMCNVFTKNSSWEIGKGQTVTHQQSNKQQQSKREFTQRIKRSQTQARESGISRLTTYITGYIGKTSQWCSENPVLSTRKKMSGLRM